MLHRFIHVSFCSVSTHIEDSCFFDDSDVPFYSFRVADNGVDRDFFRISPKIKIVLCLLHQNRNLCVLHRAILILCSVGGVQSESITVDRQMRRHEVPRVAFSNKLDRMGADPMNVLNQQGKSFDIIVLQCKCH